MSTPSLPGRSALGWIKLLRPTQWVKNFFILPAPLFGLAHSAGSLQLWLDVLGAFVAFCLVSSGVYVFNDILDAAADRLHPVKRSRLIASGRIRPAVAGALSAGLFAVGIALAAFGRRELAGIVLIYVLNSVAYALYFKHKVIADVLSISLGFMLRILGGAAAVGVEPSSWLMTCGFSLALFLGFCKRRSEIEIYESHQDAAGVRAVFASYTKEKLNLLVGIVAAMTIVTYLLFTTSPETRELHGTKSLVYTSPFVIYCVLRFLMKTLELRGEDAAETLLKDKGFLAAGFGWVASVAWILYFS